MKPASEIINILLEALGKNPNVFSKEIGLPRSQTIYDLQSGKTKSISKKLIEKIEAAYPLVDTWFLLTGQGDPLNRPIETTGAKKLPRTEVRILSQFPNEEDAARNDKHLYAPDGSIGMKVSVVPGKVQAGYLRGYPDPEFYEGFDYVIIPVDQHHKSEYLGFEVIGNSMVCLDSEELAEQSIFPGRIAVGRSLSKHQWEYKLHTHNYDNWIIAHKTEGILIKQISNHDVENGIITIHSLNPAYKDEDLHLDDIEQIFSVVQIVKKTR